MNALKKKTTYRQPITNVALISFPQNQTETKMPSKRLVKASDIEVQGKKIEEKRAAKGKLEQVTFTDALQQERGSIYGPFISNAVVSQELKAVFRATPNWELLSPDVQEMLDVVALKVARILTGEPEYDDNFVDIAGYATIVLDRIRKGKKG